MAKGRKTGRSASAGRSVRKIGRDAKTGRIIPVKVAKARRSTATVETIKTPKKGK